MCRASSISVACFWHCSISNLCDQVPSLLGASHLSLRKFFSPLTDNNTKQKTSRLFIIFCCKKRIGRIYKPMEGGYIALIYQNMCEGTNNSLHVYITFLTVLANLSNIQSNFLMTLQCVNFIYSCVHLCVYTYMHMNIDYL